jgi:hypothetical protein
MKYPFFLERLKVLTEPIQPDGLNVDSWIAYKFALYAQDKGFSAQQAADIQFHNERITHDNGHRMMRNWHRYVSLQDAYSSLLGDITSCMRIPSMHATNFAQEHLFDGAPLLHNMCLDALREHRIFATSPVANERYKESAQSVMQSFAQYIPMQLTINDVGAIFGIADQFLNNLIKSPPIDASTPEETVQRQVLRALCDMKPSSEVIGSMGNGIVLSTEPAGIYGTYVVTPAAQTIYNAKNTIALDFVKHYFPDTYIEAHKDPGILQPLLGSHVSAEQVLYAEPPKNNATLLNHIEPFFRDIEMGDAMDFCSCLYGAMQLFPSDTVTALNHAVRICNNSVTNMFKDPNTLNAVCSIAAAYDLGELDLPQV